MASPGTGDRPRPLRQVEGLVVLVGHGVSWLTLAMVLVTSLVVVLRYVLDLGWIWMQESVTWMHATVFMLAAGYTLARDEHVRVDVLYTRMDPRRRLLVDTLGTLLLLLPTCALLLATSWDYVADAWRIHEASRETGGLPGLYLVKSLLVVMPVLLAVQGVADIAARWLALGGER